MPVERRDVETIVKAEFAKLAARLDALERKVDAHQTAFAQRDEERRKKLEALNTQVAAGANGSKSQGVSEQAIKYAVGPQLNELKAHLARSLERQQADKAVVEKQAEEQRKLAEDHRKQVEAVHKHVADVKVQVDRMQVDARLKSMETIFDARLKALEARK